MELLHALACLRSSQTEPASFTEWRVPDVVVSRVSSAGSGMAGKADAEEGTAWQLLCFSGSGLLLGQQVILSPCPK